LTAPSQETINRIKAEFPDRPLYQVDAIDKDDELMSFLMTAPSRDEHKMYTKRMLAVKEVKDEDDRLWQCRMIAENAALAQIRWPDREECKKAFDARPAMVDNFHDELLKAAGSLIEFRSKKL
jgi:hypothetical protein